MSIIVDWNGNDMPRQLKELPAGRYVVESVDDVPELTEEEEEGLHQAMASLQAGKGVPADDAQLADATVSRLLPEERTRAADPARVPPKT